MEEEINIIKVICEQKCEQLNITEAKLKTQQKHYGIIKIQIINMKTELIVKESMLKCAQNECTSLKQSAYYKRLKRREKKIEECDNILKEHRNNGCEQRINALKQQVKSLQTSACKKRQLLDLCKLEFKNLGKEVKNLKTHSDDLACQLEELKQKETEQTGNTRVHGNRFGDGIVKSVIELVGENEVPAGRCAKVIKTVGKTVFDVDISMSELPSERTALRFADQGHVLAKIQLGDEMNKAEGWDLHSDGTTKDHRKYMGHQVTLNNGKTLSAGFIAVETEDTTTLLDVATGILKEVADIYSGDPENDDSEKKYKSMLENMIFATCSY